MEKSLIDDLQELGLNQYEAKVYLALLERDALTTSDVATISGVPRARTYDILESLVSKGLASLRPGKHKKYSAADIDTYKRNLIVDIEKTAVSLKRRFETIFPPADLMSNPLDYIEIIKDPALAANRFMKLRENTLSEELAFCKGPFTGDKDKLMEQVRLQCQKFKTSPHKSRAIYQIKDDSDKWQFDMIDIVVKDAGEEARICEDLPLKATVFDENIIILALPDPVINKVSFTTMVIEHRDLARVLKVAFESLWQQAKDYRVLED